MQNSALNHRTALVAADGHVHLYPAYDLRAAFRCLIQNLDRLAAATGLADPATTGNEILKLAFLTEARDHDFFGRLKDRDKNALGNGFEIISMPSSLCVVIGLPGAGQVCLVAGRQIATRERLEVLGLAMSAKIPDGLPAGEVIRRVVASGGIPVLAFSPGKWLFGRGRLARNLIESAQGGGLCLGDTTLRPLFWPAPRLMRQARALSLPIIPGSDPLPFAGEERYLGTYGFVCQGSFDAFAPAASIGRMLAAGITPAGLRCGTWTVARRLNQLRKTIQTYFPP
ncbi:MAG: hypothetical protein HYV36_01140 [Lentisphaerae bacterium]|nr:hypothetical protein [Lentisphaerota bacterium]